MTTLTSDRNKISVSMSASASGKKSLSDLLVEHTPNITRNSTQSLPKARLLTSAECLAMLEEKEMKKKKALKEKVKNRKQREEEESKRKAQKKAKKTKEKLKKAEE